MTAIIIRLSEKINGIVDFPWSGGVLPLKSLQIVRFCVAVECYGTGVALLWWYFNLAQKKKKKKDSLIVVEIKLFF